MMRIQWRTICPGGEAIHVATVRFNRSEPEPEHDHDFYECLLVCGGHGQQRIEGQWKPLAVGELYCLRPEHRHTFVGKTERPLEIINVAFAAEPFERFLKAEPPLAQLWGEGRLPASVSLGSNQSELWRSLAESAAISPRAAMDALSFYAELLKLLRPADQLAQAPLPEWLNEALPRATAPEVLHAGLPALLRLCGRSREHVSRTFSSCLGMTPTQWLNHERIRYARSLLVTSERPIIDISDACGFESLSYFHKRFREQTGFTPLKYRKRHAAIQTRV